MADNDIKAELDIDPIDYLFVTVIPWHNEKMIELHKKNHPKNTNYEQHK